MMEFTKEFSKIFIDALHQTPVKEIDRLIESLQYYRAQRVNAGLFDGSEPQKGKDENH